MPIALPPGRHGLPDDHDDNNSGAGSKGGEDDDPGPMLALAPGVGNPASAARALTRQV
jgi:hypothetical protein